MLPKRNYAEMIIILLGVTWTRDVIYLLFIALFDRLLVTWYIWRIVGFKYCRFLY